MKWFKRTIISISIISILFLAFYKPKGINLEGKWNVNEIILDGEKKYPDTLANFIDFAPEVIINGWSKTIIIPISRKKITAKLKYTDKEKDHYKIRLFSTEKSINRSFDVIVDTLTTGPQSYVVNVLLKSNKTLISLEKSVIIPPWKPEFPRKGRP